MTKRKPKGEKRSGIPPPFEFRTRPDEETAEMALARFIRERDVYIALLKSYL